MAARESLVNLFQLSSLVDRLVPRPGAGAPVSARRPDDHLVFDLLFDNLRVERGLANPAHLVREDAHRRGVLIVEFPPQSFGEQAFHQASKQDGDLSKELPARPGAKGIGPTVLKSTPASVGVLPSTLPSLPTAFVRMSGPSRLAFTMPGDVAALPFTLAAVLGAIREWPMRLDANALPDEPAFVSESERTFEVLRDALAATLDSSVGMQVSQALASAARRIAERAAGGLYAKRSSDVDGVMWEATLQESAALFDRHPILREGDRHTATLAALAVGSTAELSRLAESSGAADESAVLLERAPYLPLLRGQPHEPATNSTALELPYRLFISPMSDAHWQHGVMPVTRHGRTELWHTRLATTPPSGVGTVPSQIRALWSPDFERAPDPRLPFHMPLDAQDRAFLVHLTADWTQNRADMRFKYRPRPALVNRLHLSSLGALLDAGGEWDPRPENVDLEQWRHLATLGRDHYVRVVYAGFLMPFGHAASLVKVTERTFESLGDDGRIAVLRTRFFIIVRQRTRTYASETQFHKYGGRSFPFGAVEILTEVTPELLPPKLVPLNSPPPLDPPDPPDPAPLEAPPTLTDRMAFWPEVPGDSDVDRNFRFEVVATDVSGQRVTFSVPMLFVSEVVNAKLSVNLRHAYSEADHGRRTAQLGGDGISYDQTPGANPDDSRLSTTQLRFATRGLFPFDHASGTRLSAFPLRPNFFPEVEHTSVNVPALQRLLGRSDPFAMTYPLAKTAAEFINPGGVFLWAETIAKLGFGGDTQSAQTDGIGGLAAPEMQIVGLSRLTGPVSGKPSASGIQTSVANVVKNQFSPADFFSGATLLGGIDLAAIVQVAAAAGLDAAPQFHSTEGIAEAVTNFEWETELKTAKPFLANADGKSGSRLVMHAEVVTPKEKNGVATRQASAVLNNFKLDLFGCIILWFDRVTFDVKPGQKPDVSVQLTRGEDAVTFGGALAFVNELRKYIPSNGFSDPPALSVTPSGIAASYSLGLPTMPLGIFSLSNVSLGAGFNLPFDNRSMSLRFSFCERQRPFSLIVSGLGGGGFAAITIGAGGVQEIEAALEFGAAVAINLGVASGAVEIKAGMYFNWKDDVEVKGGGKTQMVVLAGYVRIHGELTVLCLVSASLTFNLQLGFQKSGGESMVFGEAELIVEIEVLFLSFDVRVRCRREFAGTPGDPKFIDLIPDASVWDDYCGAFASEAA
jgi:hypothetical protein